MIGKVLLANQVISEAQLERALAEQRTSGGLLGEILLRMKFVGEDALAKALAHQAAVPFLRVDGLVADPMAVALVPEAFARQHTIAPVALTDGGLRVIQANPFDVIAIDELQRLTGRYIEVECATPSDILNLINRSYSDDGAVAALVEAGLASLDERISDGAVSQSPVVRLIERLLNDAIARAATDLHIEPEERLVRLRYRIDGVLTPGETLPKELHAALVSRIKVMAGLDIAEQRMPQDGRITQQVGDQRVDLRVATFPTTFGEKVAIRVLAIDRLVRGLEELGFNPANYAVFRDLLTKSRGIILVTGPTGAGKTTTLYSALAYLASRERNILTVEDPVEYHLPAIRQTQIRPKAGFTFATAIRSLLRQDPDVIMVGEIRDAETAQLALRAALSGVLIFSTLHTQDSAGAIPRLMDMGLEPYLLASGLVGVVAQRLLRVICPDCKEPTTYPAETLAKVGLEADPGVVFFHGRGCGRCGHSGYRGRIGAFEILKVDPTIHSLIRDRADSRLIKAAAVNNGLTPLMDNALAKALVGLTTLDEVLRVGYE